MRVNYTFELELRDVRLQENIDFGCGILYSLLDRDWDSFQEFGKFDLLL